MATKEKACGFYQIFTLRKDNKWERIARVSDNKIIISRLLTSVFKLMEVFLPFVRDFVERRNKNEELESRRKEVFNNGLPNDKIEMVILDIMEDGRSTVFITLQYAHNTKQTRILAYACSKVIHFEESHSSDIDIKMEDLLKPNLVDSIIAKYNNTIAAVTINDLKAGHYNLFL